MHVWQNCREHRKCIFLIEVFVLLLSPWQRKHFMCTAVERMSCVYVCWTHQMKNRNLRKFTFPPQTHISPKRLDLWCKRWLLIWQTVLPHRPKLPEIRAHDSNLCRLTSIYVASACLTAFCQECVVMCVILEQQICSVWWSFAPHLWGITERDWFPVCGFLRISQLTSGVVLAPGHNIDLNSENMNRQTVDHDM